MWMKPSAAIGPSTQRNFLRENKLLVRQSPMMTLRRLQRGREANQEFWHSASYELPTAASLARRSGTLPLLETQRRLMNGDRQGRSFYRQGGRQSEKQIQTEDISDEQFLNAALLKCTESQSRLMRGCSEGDELPAPTAAGCAEASCLRRTASNFELGKAPAQRACSIKQIKQPKQPLAAPAQPDPGVSCVPTGLLEQPAAMEAAANAESASTCARGSVPHVMQLAMPDVTDVEPEPQLDQSLSARTNASCHSQVPKRAETPPAAAAASAKQSEQNQLKPSEDQVLLPEAQRVALLEAAQARHRELIWEYNRLPISMGTLRVRNLKIQLEQQLDMIDSDLSVLNLPEVYIKRDQLQQISSISC